MKNRNRNLLCARPAGFLLLAVLLAAAVLAALRTGSAKMDGEAFWGGLLGKEEFRTEMIILRNVRLPRVIAAVLAGAGLSVSGVLLQGVTGNELAGPNIIGVNSGAGFAVILLLYAVPGAFYALPFAAFAGAFLTTVLIVGIASGLNRTRSMVILTGIAVTAVLNAGISFITYLDPDLAVTYHYFQVGGISGVRTEELYVPAVLIAGCIAAAVWFAPHIDALCLGDGVASSIGVPVKRLRLICMILASAGAAAVVSYAGLLGFVGLVVPHIARRLAGYTMRRLIPAAALVGAILVVAADLAGRVVFAPSEVPVGIVMALIGAPFFFFLLVRRRNEEV